MDKIKTRSLEQIKITECDGYSLRKFHEYVYNNKGGVSAECLCFELSNDKDKDKEKICIDSPKDLENIMYLIKDALGR